MKKIKSVFKRDYSKNRTVNNRYVSILKNKVNEECQWVLDGEGVATIKFDGTSCMIKDGILYKRYDCKRGRTKPVEGIPCEDKPDEVTGHWPWWVPVHENDKSSKYHIMAMNSNLPDGTYELVGPKIQSNPHNLESYSLIKHGQEVAYNFPRTFQGMKNYLADGLIEGIVFHHEDGRMAKIKTNDFFPKKWGKK